MIKLENNEDLLKLISKYPDYQIVTDVGISMFSGFSKLIGANVDDDECMIELVFDD